MLLNKGMLSFLLFSSRPEPFLSVVVVPFAQCGLLLPARHRASPDLPCPVSNIAKAKRTEKVPICQAKERETIPLLCLSSGVYIINFFSPSAPVSANVKLNPLLC